MQLFSEKSDAIQLRYGLGRDEFEELFPSFEDRQKPLKTPVVLSQLRARGYDANEVTFGSICRGIRRDRPKAWAKIEEILRPRGGRDFFWSPEMIDDLADHMEQIRLFTPSGTAAMRWGYKLADEIRLIRLYESNSGRGDVALEIIPGLPGAGVPATLKARRVTQQELDAVELAAKQLAKKSKKKE